MSRSLSRYSMVAIVLHWLLALAILLNIWIGWQFDDLKGAAKAVSLQWHQSIGMTILVLTVLRLAWRLVNRPPPYPPTMARWEKFLASATHWAFYVLTLAVPMTGWLLASASRNDRPIELIGGLRLPTLPGIQILEPTVKALKRHQYHEAHTLFSWMIVVLLVLHVLAALKHQLFDRDAVLSRMLPLSFLRPKATAARPE